jgi:DNA ligase (NAD+)
VGDIGFLRALGFLSPDASHHPTLDAAMVEVSPGNTAEFFAFETDGMVIEINDLVLARAWVLLANPRHCLQFPAQEVTRLLDIGVNVGRRCAHTLRHARAGGHWRVIVKQATLHNFDYIAEKDIRIGDRVRVKRRVRSSPVIGPVVELRSGRRRIPAACGLPGVRRASREALRRGGVVLR